MVKFSRTNVDRRIAFVIFAVALAVYARQAAPGLLYGDPGEFQFAAWRWGLAHATGYPLYLLVGGLWQRLLYLVGISPDRALNLLSSVTGAFAVAFLYLLMRGWFTGPAQLTRWAALFTAFLFAVNPTFWSQTLITEVYALHALFVVLILLAAQALEWHVRGSEQKELPWRRFALLWLLVGLSLTHHAMTLFIIPGLLIFLWQLDRDWWRSLRAWAMLGVAVLLPLFLYLYIPLRSGPAATPWYHQQLGDSSLVLYDNSWPSFVNFMTGRSISVGFHSFQTALDNLGLAGFLWKEHFGWPGLLLMGLGLWRLVRDGRHTILALTMVYALLQQVFNLFYAIDDILVYYIPVYLMGVIWAGFGAHGLASGAWRTARTTSESNGESPIPEQGGQDSGEAVQPATDAAAMETATSPATERVGILVLILVLLLPVSTVGRYWSVLDQSGEYGARETWERILAAQPPADAILVSNDRNEMVPLFYLQAVEGRARGQTGLFPLITAEPRFADIGATLETALELGSPQPVFLIKEMPGLEIRYAQRPATPPLVEVLGPAATDDPPFQANADLGPLTLIGYDWQLAEGRAQVELYWRVRDAPDADYTTTVQIFDADEAKLGQDDAPPGGSYYPTSLWKAGETLRERHIIDLPAERLPTFILVGMYRGGDLEPLASPLRLPLERSISGGP